MREMRIILPHAYLTPDTREDARKRRQDKLNKRLGIKPPPKGARIIPKPKHYELRLDLIKGKETPSRSRRRFVEVYKRYVVIILKRMQRRIKRRKERKFIAKMKRIASFKKFRIKWKITFRKWLQYWELKW